MSPTQKQGGLLATVMSNPKIVLLLVGLLVAFGIYGLDKMNKQEFPEFVIRQGIVAAAYPGASAEEVEQQVALPLEEYLFTFNEVDKRNTYSYIKEGIVYVYVSFDLSVNNQTEVWSKIRHGLKDFRPQLPAGVAAVVVVDDFGSSSALLITMDSEEKSYREMDRYMDLLKQRLRTIPAAGNIRSLGALNEQVTVRLDKEKLATYGISEGSLSSHLFAEGLLTVGGSLAADDGVLPLHVVSPLQTEAELADQVVLRLPTGQSIRLKDVATLTREYEEPSSYVTRDGRHALVLSIEMRPGNNIVKFGEEVDAIMKDFGRLLPDGVELYRITDLPRVVDESVWSFMRDLVTAIIVVILVMLLLFPLTTALIPAIEIPLTTAITLSIMYIVGYELNTVTLAALIVTLGMIVDDSIVLIDGYMDNLRHGERPWDAALHSAKSYFPSLVVATISICAIFFPFLFTMHGPLGDFVKFFPTTISISLFTSLALGMLLTPWLEQKIIKPAGERRENKFTQVQNHFFNSLQNGYEWLLSHCFGRPWLTIGVGVGSVALAVVVFLLSPLQLMPKAERDNLAVEIFLPEGSSLAQTARVAEEFEAVLQADPDVLTVTTFVGTSSPRFMTSYTPQMPGVNFAQMIVSTRSNSVTEQVVERYKDTYIDHYPEASVRVKQLDYQAVNNPVEVRLYGNDPTELRRYGDTLRTFMQRHGDDLVWVHSDWDGFRPSLRIELKPEEASRLGISRATLSAALATLNGGLPITSMWEEDYKVEVVLRTTDSDSALAPSQLADLMVPTALPGVWVPLRQVADISADWGPAKLAHRGGTPCLTMGADLRFGHSQPVTMKKLRPYLEGEFSQMLPDDIRMEYGGLDAVNADTVDDIIVGLVAAIFIVFFFLLFNFKQIRLTLLALCGTLLCLLGAFVGLRIFNLDISLTAIIGVVSLIGINVRNTIVMFDYAESLREQGMPLRQVAYEAGRRRMRPIFLTSATTAVGVIPMITHRSALWMPMGVVICFGTIMAIVLIVTVMPVAYWKLFSRRRRLPKALSVLPLLLLAMPLSAQPAAEPLRLDSCISLALRQSAPVQQSQLALQQAQQTRRAALTKFFPTLAANATYFHSPSYLVDVHTNQIGAETHLSVNNNGGENAAALDDLRELMERYGVDLEQAVDDLVEQLDPDLHLQMLDHGFFAGIVATQPLFAGGRIVNGNRMARKGVEAARLQQQMTLDEVREAVEGRYWLVVSLQEKMRTVDQALLMLDTLERDAATACEAGLLRKTDLLKVRLKKNEMLGNQSALKNGVVLATMALCQYVGLPFLDSVSHQPIAYTLADRLPDDEPHLASSAVDPVASVGRRAETQLLHLAADVEHLRTMMQMGESLPQLFLGGTYGVNNIMSNGYRTNGLVLFSLQVPLTAWWENGHQIHRQRLAEQQALLTLRDASEQMQLQTLQAWHQLVEAHTQLRLKQQALHDAEENLLDVRHHYQAGLVSVADYLEAQTLLQQARSDKVDSQIALQQQQLLYDRLTCVHVRDE